MQNNTMKLGDSVEGHKYQTFIPTTTTTTTTNTNVVMCNNIAATVSTPYLLDLCLSAKHISNQSCLHITVYSTTISTT